MKFVKDKNGNLLFSPEEWRTVQQISSFFFSRLSTIQRQIKANRAGPVRGAQGWNSRGRLRSAGIWNCLQRFTPGGYSWYDYAPSSHWSRDKKRLRAIKGKETSNTEVSWAEGAMRKPANSSCWVTSKEEVIHWATEKEQITLFLILLPSMGNCSTLVKKYDFSANMVHFEFKNHRKGHITYFISFYN